MIVGHADLFSNSQLAPGSSTGGKTDTSPWLMRASMQ
jgi:hypothetical protein